MTQPITIRADTPREAVEEVCKWLEESAVIVGAHVDRWPHAPELRALLRSTQETYELAANALRSATIEPKEQADD
jgi:hypothetical protein